jgi:anaerobic selenocysteine-containing dehydrogenase
MTAAAEPTRTAFRTCPLCEATCGLAVTLRGDEVVEVRGDAQDVFSRGFLCPKGVGLKALHEDPDRVRTPLRRRADGSGFDPVSWEEALAFIGERVQAISAAHGRDAIAAYLGNPGAHSLGILLYGRVFLKALGSRSIFSASTVDQRPKEISSGLLFGHSLSVPIPDVDRTQHLLILGANPLASNGSLLTAPDLRGRLRAIQQRGGKVVVVDPRRTRTAELADEHVPIRPGTDALLLFALVHVLADEGLLRPGRLAHLTDGIETVTELAEPFSPEAVAPATGIDADTIRRMARELAQAERAAVYGRIGTTAQEFGTLASWLVDVLNVLTGNLDAEGGALFTKAAAGARNTQGEPGRGRGLAFGRRRTRVRGLPDALGELPAPALAEEIDTPGEGQIRALFTLAGNPARSLPNSSRMERALEQLELLVCLDVYVNETTRHADVILPAPSPLQKSHYDLALYQLACRNVANYSPALLPLGSGEQDEWVTLLRLTGAVTGQGPTADTAAIDDFVASALVGREVADPHSPLHGRAPEDVLAELAPRRGPERLLDLMLRCGPYDLTLADLEAAPHGIDLGPLQPRLPDVLRTPSGRIELAPEPLVADVARLRAALERAAEPGSLLLIGRRHLRSNNSWMHNLPLLMRGPQRCTLLVHPEDAARAGLAAGERAHVSSAAGSVEALVEVSDEMAPGVVSLPHGWGHDGPGLHTGVAAAHAGTNVNALSDETLVDALSGNAVLNGIPVELAPVREPALT